MAKVADKQHVIAPAATSAMLVPPPLPTSTAPALPVLTPEHLRQINDARLRGAKIRRALSVAKFDAWSVGIFGGLTFLCALASFSLVGLLLGGGMLAVFWIELRAADRLRKLDASTIKTLAVNQLLLGGLLLAYGLYSLWGVYHEHSPIVDELTSMPNVPGVGDAVQLAHLIGAVVYGTLIAVAIFGQGGTALYYHTRRKHLDAYLRETPPWIVDAQRAGMPLL
jgi:hypothetical protein